MTAIVKVSHHGQMSLPAEARRRSDLTEGGEVEVLDLGDSLMIVPLTPGGLKAVLERAIDEAGGYEKLAADVAAADPDLM